MRMGVWFAGIRGSLLLLFTIGALCLGSTNVIVYLAFQESDSAIDLIAGRRLPITQSLGEGRSHFEASMHYTWRALSSASSPDRAAGYSKLARENWQTSKDRVEALTQLGLHSDNLKRIETIKENSKLIEERLAEVWTWIERRAQAGSTVEVGDPKQGVTLDVNKLNDISKPADEVNQLFMTITELNANLGKEAAQTVREQINQAKQRVIFLGLLGVVALMAVSLFVSIRASRRLTKIGLALEKGSGEVAASSQQLASAAEELSSSAQSQASALEQASASLEQISGMVESNSKNAEQSHLLATQVEEKSLASDKQIKALASSMDEILRSNERIEKLVKLIEEIGEKTEVIDEIVFQTRLLSFNASVEAERAGEHGRGFAVVAQEVGNLAQMSGQSAVQISSIVKSAVREAGEVASGNKQRVLEGVEQCQTSVQKIDEVVQSVKRILASSEQILQACREQSTGLKQISASVESLNQSTQSTAATAEESSAASHSLFQQSDSLRQSVGVLKVIVDGAGQDTSEEKAMSSTDSRERSPAKASREGKVIAMKVPKAGTPTERGSASPVSQKAVSGNSAWDAL